MIITTQMAVAIVKHIFSIFFIVVVFKEGSGLECVV
jgi:hypothetical protein